MTRSNKPDQTTAWQRALQTKNKKNLLESKPLQTFFSFFCWTIFPLQAMIDYTEVPKGTKVGQMCLSLRIFTHFEHFFVSFHTSATTRAPWRRDCFKVILPSKQLLSRPSLSDDRLSAFQCNHLRATAVAEKQLVISTLSSKEQWH